MCLFSGEFTFLHHCTGEAVRVEEQRQNQNMSSPLRCDADTLVVGGLLLIFFLSKVFLHTLLLKLIQTPQLFRAKDELYKTYIGIEWLLRSVNIMVRILPYAFQLRCSKSSKLTLLYKLYYTKTEKKEFSIT